MQKINRRNFLQLVGASAALAIAPQGLRAATTAPRVVVVGGGFAGATAAKYLKLWGGAGVDVTLVEPNAAHVSCILSNLVLTNQLNMASITLGYEGLKQQGVNIVQARAMGIDPVSRIVELDTGVDLPYDRVILAPGIDFVDVPGLDFNRVPHAWQAGSQTTLLANQLQSMPTRGTFVMTIPKAPYRCPPGPYERACVVADYMKRKKGGGKVIVLDANPNIMAEPHTFSMAFGQTYAGMIEYHTNANLIEVDSTNRIARTNLGDVQANVLNVLPPMKAGKVAFNSGVVASGALWASVDPLSYESTLMPGVHIIGDSQGTSQPKSGHIANSEAKVCVDAILRAFNGLPPDQGPMTNSACFSPITAKSASWLTAVFAYDAAEPVMAKRMKPVAESFGEAAGPSGDNYEDMFAWANNLFADSFM